MQLCCISLYSTVHCTHEDSKSNINSIVFYISRFKRFTILHFCFAEFTVKSKINHYENPPIQIYRKFHLQKLKIFRKKKTLIFFSYFCSKHRLWVLVRTASPRQSMFSSRNMKNNVYPCKPQFCYIKVGFKGVKLI